MVHADCKGTLGEALDLCPLSPPCSLPLLQLSMCLCVSWLQLHLRHTLGLRGAPCPAAQPGQAELLTECSYVAVTWRDSGPTASLARGSFCKVPKGTLCPKRLGYSLFPLGSSAPGLTPQGTAEHSGGPKLGCWG